MVFIYTFSLHFPHFFLTAQCQVSIVIRAFFLESPGEIPANPNHPQFLHEGSGLCVLVPRRPPSSASSLTTTPVCRPFPFTRPPPNPSRRKRTHVAPYGSDRICDPMALPMPLSRKPDSLGPIHRSQNEGANPFEVSLCRSSLSPVLYVPYAPSVALGGQPKRRVCLATAPSPLSHPMALIFFPPKFRAAIRRAACSCFNANTSSCLFFVVRFLRFLRVFSPSISPALYLTFLHDPQLDGHPLHLALIACFPFASCPKP